jgi:argininosuccinate lyase
MIGKKVSEMGLTAKMLADAKDPWRNVEKRSIIGGPAPKTVRVKIGVENGKLHSDEKKLAALSDHLVKSREELAAEIKLITGEPS